MDALGPSRGTSGTAPPGVCVVSHRLDRMSAGLDDRQITKSSNDSNLCPPKI